MKPRFREGEAVRVRDLRHAGHLRTPAYVRGRVGRIAAIVGPKLNPERLAYGENGVPAVVLYRVRFGQATVWPGYAGTANDTIDVELYEHWLEIAGGAAEGGSA